MGRVRDVQRPRAIRFHDTIYFALMSSVVFPIVLLVTVLFLLLIVLFAALYGHASLFILMQEEHFFCIDHPPMVPAVMVPVLKRKRTAQSHGAPANKKTGTRRNDLEVVFSGICSIHRGVRLSNVGAGASGSGIGLGSLMPGALSKMDDALAVDERTDEENEACSSELVDDATSAYPSFSWTGSQGMVAMNLGSSQRPVVRSDPISQRNAAGKPAATGVPDMFFGAPLVIQRDGRLEMEEWGWFVDAAEDELRIATTSR